MSRPVPNDFAKNAAVMGQKQLRARYSVGNSTLYRWSNESGIRFLASKAIPEDFAENAGLMGVTALAAHYECGRRMLERWFNELGIKPVKAAPYQPKRPYMLKPVPDDFVALAPTMCRADLQNRYKVSHYMIGRWLSETGATPGRRVYDRRVFNLTPTAGRAVQFSPIRASLHDIAADDLRRANWVVYRCDERGRYSEKGHHWRVGNLLCDADELLARAERVRRKAA